MSAATARGVLSTSRTVCTPQWRGKRLVKPPIHLPRAADRGGLTVEEIPHAETSAAGAARYQRLHSFGSITPSPKQSNALLAASSQRYFSTTASGSRRLPSFNTHANTTAEAKSRATSRWNARNLRYADDVGWKTPADLASGTSASDWKGKQSILPKWLGTDMDRELVRRSIFRHTLTVAYDSLEDVLAQLPTCGDDERGRIRLQLANTIEAVLKSTEPAQGPHAVQPPPVLPADATAFRIIARSIVLAQIELQSTDDEILNVFRSMRERFGRLSLPQYHRIVSSAGLNERNELILAFFTEAQRDWDGATDEWMLYARARALATLGKATRVLDSYWKEYETCRAAPPEAYGRHAGVSTERKLHPPRYLFTSLLQYQLVSAARSTSGQSFGRTKEVLRAMNAYGFEPDQNVYLLLLGTSPSLRLHLPDLLDWLDREAQLYEPDPKARPGDVFLQLLVRRVGDLAVRDVLRLLDLMGIARAGSKRRHTPKSTPLFPTRMSSHDEQLGAHAAVAYMYGRLAQPQRALFHFQACWKLREHDYNHEWCGRAAASVIVAYNLAQEPQAGIDFGLALINPTLDSDSNASPLLPHTATYGALIRAAATLPSEKDAIEVVRVLLSLLVQQGVSFDRRIRQSLAALFYTALGPGDDGLEGIRQLLEKLSDVAQSLPISPNLPLTKPTESEEILLNPSERKRIGMLLMELSKQGFEHRLELRNFKKRTGRVLRSRRLIRRAAAVALERESAEWIRSYSDQVFPYGTDPLVGYHRETDQNNSPADAHITAPSGTPDNRSSRNGIARHHRQEDAFSSSLGGEVAGPEAVQAAEDAAMDVEEDFEESLSAAGYAMRLRVFSVVRRDHVAAAHLFRSMHDNGVKPSMLHVAPIVEGLCLDGRVEEARSVAQNASKKLGVLTTARIQSAILRALIQEGRLSEARAELGSWIKAGGSPNDYLQHIFDDVEFPRLAREQTFRVALAEAQAADKPLHLGEVDDAFRFLMRTQRFVSAQRLVLQAVQQTGTLADYSLRVAVRNASKYLRKVLHRRGVEPEAEPVEPQKDDNDRIYLFTPPSASVLTLPSRRDSWSDDIASSTSPLDLPAENDDDSLRSAFSLSTQLRHLLHIPSNKELQRQKAARAQFRHDLETLVMDIAKGVYSIAALQGKQTRLQRQMAKEIREEEEQHVEGLEFLQRPPAGGAQLRERARERAKEREREREKEAAALRSESVSFSRASRRAFWKERRQQQRQERQERQQRDEQQRAHQEAGIVAAGLV
ncbi:hypothetical protein BCV69DRAFT_284039 [Microstroma glucosiphilum]|uniref:Pentacotripeptide-repeat region of PRORP domain-containing protein n=1 Tax=Pseudomicrostroma glucosiphilum TaxID=1684307 RepID=A0A316U218_9BASI|nr:hypothetical protein BCV69DRAFT_284039 [Pseudomicrostroma glucosiphilum]PWN19406.1 hypothetical protein BCV69DRAFT_284039 [Pseudomicrostroma glucosiphilum]